MNAPQGTLVSHLADLSHVPQIPTWNLRFPLGSETWVASARLGHKTLRTLMKRSNLWYLPGVFLEWKHQAIPLTSSIKFLLACILIEGKILPSPILHLNQVLASRKSMWLLWTLRLEMKSALPCEISCQSKSKLEPHRRSQGLSPPSSTAQSFSGKISTACGILAWEWRPVEENRWEGPWTSF